ncbi:PQQ-dependent sugar dehydrogenase [Pedobacter sp. GR22-6]|uniref:PQQ-dependent sugar dehydrogenase n=1 Tax=Pedobacter sp. GR22-6 TaxID=3127957 RepID=UPI00307CCA57
MKAYLVPASLFLLICIVFSSAVAPEPQFERRIIASGLSDPWAVAIDPNGSIWVNESKGYRVLKIDPSTGRKIVVLDLSAKREFPDFDLLKKVKQATPQGGLMGLALHPQFSSGQPYVYLAYVYRQLEGNHFLLRLARYRYNPAVNKLSNKQVICDTVPASNDHNGGRMVIAPVKGTPYLFYAVGDQGAGQFSNGGRQNKAQNPHSYEGKILRFGLSPSSSGAWIPRDNPISEKSAIWSLGHRNPQGLAFTSLAGKDKLYSSEHGPYSDDEINEVIKGGNYGHPLVIGYADGNYDGLAASVSTEKSYPGRWHTSYPLIRSERRNSDSIGKTFREPIYSFYPTGRQILSNLFTAVQSGEKADWNAYAPSGIAIYHSKVIPDWDQSILVTSLKQGKLLRLKLKADGSVDQRVSECFASRARYRDVTVSRDGTRIYLVTDSSAITSGPTEENPKATSLRGCLLEFKLKP